MRIRQYQAASMQEARLKIKMDLGPDAVILHSRTFKKGGFLGFGGKEVVEVLAALEVTPAGGDSRPGPTTGNPTGSINITLPEETPVAPTPDPVPEPGPRLATEPSSRAPVPGAQSLAQVHPSPVSGPLSPVIPHAGPGPESSRVGASADPASGASRMEPSRGSGALAETDPALTRLAPEVDALKAAVGEVRQILGTVVGKLDQGQVRQARGEWAPALASLFDRLVESGLPQSRARDLVSSLDEAGFTEPSGEALDSLEPILGSWVSCGGGIELATPARPRIVALVGPTGVGKTTTIAKLAANFRLLQNKRVALVTNDTYRVAAVEQLRTYGDLIRIPIEVVQTPQAMREAIGRNADADLILIDTAGRSPSHPMHLQELGSFLDLPVPREVHLVLSATTNRGNLERVVEAFEPVGLDRLLFTKIDETVNFGAMIALAAQLEKPLSYLTTGQNVPQDIQVAERDAVVRLLIDELKRS
ncbi:MAG: flagellar biosynthesis protein FlhF [bacterium]|nr:flagellar biosynthesis protein FlhF [bacterium]